MPHWIIQLCSSHDSLENQELNDRKFAVNPQVFPVSAMSPLGVPHCCLGWASAQNLYWPVFAKSWSPSCLYHFSALSGIPQPLFKNALLKTSWGKLAFHLKLIWACCVYCSTTHKALIHPHVAASISLSKPKFSVAEIKSWDPGLTEEQWRKGTRPQILLHKLHLWAKSHQTNSA